MGDPFHAGPSYNHNQRAFLESRRSRVRNLWRGEMKLRRRVAGILKDNAAISRAIAHSKFSALHVALLRATSHEESPPDEKDVNAVLSGGSSSRLRVSQCVEELMKRLDRTHNWAVALKSLILLHRALRGGAFIFQDRFALCTANGGRNLLNLSNFKDRSSPETWQLSAWVRAYAGYVDQWLATWRALGAFPDDGGGIRGPERRRGRRRVGRAAAGRAGGAGGAAGGDLRVPAASPRGGESRGRGGAEDGLRRQLPVAAGDSGARGGGRRENVPVAPAGRRAVPGGRGGARPAAGDFLRADVRFAPGAAAGGPRLRRCDRPPGAAPGEGEAVSESGRGSSAPGFAEGGGVGNRRWAPLRVGEVRGAGSRQGGAPIWRSRKAAVFDMTTNQGLGQHRQYRIRARSHGPSLQFFRLIFSMDVGDQTRASVLDYHNNNSCEMTCTFKVGPIIN